MAVMKTKVVVKVELPVGKLGLTVAKSPPEVGAVGTGSPVVGQVAPGDIIVALTCPGLGDVDTTSMDGQAVMETLVAYADREGRSLTVEKHGIYDERSASAWAAWGAVPRWHVHRARGKTHVAAHARDEGGRHAFVREWPAGDADDLLAG